MSAQRKANLQASIESIERECIRAAKTTKTAAMALKRAETRESALTNKLETLHKQLIQLELEDSPDRLHNAPLSTILAHYMETANETPTDADKRYFAGIPAQITRGTEHIPSQTRTPVRGDIVMITHQYASKNAHLDFPQLNVIGAVKYHDPKRNRIGITVAPGKTIEKSGRYIVILLQVPEYDKAHVNDLPSPQNGLNYT